MKHGSKVVCIDDEGWLVPYPGREHLSPTKGMTYVVNKVEYFGRCMALSLIGGHAGDFYRASRFRPLAETPNLAATETQEATR